MSRESKTERYMREAYERKQKKLVRREPIRDEELLLEVVESRKLGKGGVETPRAMRINWMSNAPWAS